MILLGPGVITGPGDEVALLVLVTQRLSSSGLRSGGWSPHHAPGSDLLNLRSGGCCVLCGWRGGSRRYGLSLVECSDSSVSQQFDSDIKGRVRISSQVRLCHRGGLGRGGAPARRLGRSLTHRSRGGRSGRETAASCPEETSEP